MRRQNEDLKSELQSFKMETKYLLRNMSTNVQKLYRAPAITQNFSTIENGQNQGRGDVRSIPLLKCPRTLEVFWTEYEFGVTGNKATKFFTVWERKKYWYSRHKPFWTLVERMIRYGYTHASTTENINSVYANNTSKSITQSLREIRVDSRRGGHPSLQYSF